MNPVNAAADPVLPPHRPPKKPEPTAVHAHNPWFAFTVTATLCSGLLNTFFDTNNNSGHLFGIYYASGCLFSNLGLGIL